MTYEGAMATILLEYCVENSCEDCDNCALRTAIEALAKQQTTKYNHLSTRHPQWGKRIVLVADGRLTGASQRAIVTILR